MIMKIHSGDSVGAAAHHKKFLSGRFRGAGAAQELPALKNATRILGIHGRERKSEGTAP